VGVSAPAAEAPSWARLEAPAVSMAMPMAIAVGQIDKGALGLTGDLV
jgi:hypothetical protein